MLKLTRWGKFDLFIVLGFSFLLILIIAMSLLGITGLETSRSLFGTTYHHQVHAWVSTEQARADLTDAHRTIMDVALSENEAQYQAAIERLDSYDKRIRTYFDQMTQTEPDDTLLLGITQAYDEWVPLRERTIALAGAGDTELAIEYTRTVCAAQVWLIEEKMQLMIDRHRIDADTAIAESENTTLLFTRFLRWMTVLAVLLAVAISFYIRSRLLKSQALLHEEKEKLQITFDSIGDGIITTDIHRNVTALNKVAEAQTGWTIQNAVGRAFSEVFNITNAITGEPAKDPVEEVLQTDAVCQLENHTILTSKDGTKRHIADSAAPIKDENGVTTGVVMIFRDVTERKMAENELRLSERRLKTAQAIAHVGNWELDLATKEMWASQEAFNIYGLPYDSPYLPLQKAQRGVRENDRPMMNEALQLLITENTTYDVQFAIHRENDGEMRYIHSNAVLERAEDGTPHKVVGTIQDITTLKNAELQNIQTSLRLEATLEATGDGIEAVDMDGNIIFCNTRFKEMWQLIDSYSTAHDFFDHIMAMLDEPPQVDSFSDLLEHLKEEPFNQLALTDGRIFERYANPILLDDAPIGYVLSYRDITAQKRFEQALLASETKHKAMIANISDSIVIVDQNNVATYVSPNTETLFGWNLQDLQDNPLTSFVHPEDLDRVRSEMSVVSGTNGSAKTLELRVLCKDERYIHIQLTAVNMLQDENIQGILINFHDITDRKKWEGDILYLNYHDTLTGLYNRAFFEEEGNRLDCPRQLPISVIMGDINGLKLINDAFGHREGDKLLVEISKILAGSCRKEDILARTGGDEFCVLLPQTTNEEARSICERILNDCKVYENKTDKETFYLSISLGHATKTDMSISIENLLAIAEEQMYKQKLLDRKSLRSTLIASIKTTMHEQSHVTADHEQRLVSLSKRIGNALGLPDSQINELELLTALHDIGKLSISDHILNKPDNLTAEEWSEIFRHPDVGYRIAQASPELTPISDYILCHHEHWDGTGYPQGLKGTEIPLLSRIIAVVDAFDAMTQDRPYQKAMSEEETISELLRNAGTQFDPEIVRLFIEQLAQ